MSDDLLPYIKEHDNKTICFADTLVQAKTALDRKELKNEDAGKLDGAHLMLFGVEEWKKADLKSLKGAMKNANNTFERLEIFGCEMKEADQLSFGDLLDPENLSRVKQFDLDNTQLEPKGAAAIFAKLSEVPSIHTLNLQGSIGGKSAVLASVADKLVENCNLFKGLTKLDLKINELKPDAAVHAATIMGRLQQRDAQGKCEVDLFYNEIGAVGTKSLCHALQLSTCVITHLDLCCNNIGDEGGVAIGDMLRTNRSLLVLKLALNNIGNKGCIAICKSLAPRFYDKNRVKNTVLEVLDISANVMKEMEMLKKTGVDDELIAARAVIEKQQAEMEDINANPLPERRASWEKLEAKLEETQNDFKENENFPVCSAVANVFLYSHLKEFDFTGIELGSEVWTMMGHQLSTTHNKSLQKRGVPMKIRFSIVDLMNEENLKTMEKFIWDNNQKEVFKHIDWRRRDEPTKKD